MARRPKIELRCLSFSGGSFYPASTAPMARGAEMTAFWRLMAQGSYQIGGEEVREENSWRYPLMLLVATLVLSAVFLYYYFGPDVEEIAGNKLRPTIADDTITATVGGIDFEVPANYTLYPKDRRNGDREVLALFASWPRFDGFTPSRRRDFIENATDSRRIDIEIALAPLPFSEADRLEIQYKPHLADQEGQPFDYGLTHYRFKSAGEITGAPSGYTDKELFLGEASDGQMAVLFCYLEDPSGVIPSECYRTYDLSRTVSVKYKFKKEYLSEWRDIDAGIRNLIADFAGV
ncbi:hypothetical protein PB2503_08929 [Parvularcula bermudensis HTCC2503]|uniref:Uncharacterized protein n=2 Tax=Parvularcula TaxID=208215 RepID=E0TCE9_PARBH|nr:hypothetical protein PB2503_08929 [Parvularcula bermudensis HTCC2503]